MLKIGLTGGIGAGKSTVAARLAGHGAVVVDADRLAREVLDARSEGLAAVVDEFGPQVLAADGTLDRAALAAVAFADDERRRALEAITHPRIAARTAELVAAAPADAVVVHDVPLLVEKRMGPAYHLVLVVDAPVPVRVARLAAGRGMPASDALARIRAQATPEQRRAAADVELDTDRPPESVDADVDELWSQRLVPFERNVRTGTAVRGPEVPALVPYDERWPAQAARWAARVAAAAASVGGCVEHVGPTAVPGLPAPGVLDLVLGVPSDERIEALRPAMRRAGLAPLHDRVGDGEGEGEGVGVGGGERRSAYGGCDPAVPVRVDVVVHEGAAWRTAVLVRDRLRTDPLARRAWAEQAEQAARTARTVQDFAAGQAAYAAAVAAQRLTKRTSSDPS